MMGGSNDPNTSSDMNMSSDVFNQVREAADTEFEKKGSAIDDEDNIIGGLGGSISGGHDETVMMGQEMKPEERKFGAFDNDKIDESIGEDDEVDIGKETKD